ncbi:MAG TPA: hypothetical protein VEV81_10535 [Pyrinomonadaceae bacterium]|nr:hypothetical protein [Pyrinomonadaceae bacterium]
MSSVKRVVLLNTILIVCFAQGRTQQQQGALNDNVVRGSLFELRNKRRVLLLVQRSSVVDAREQGRAIMAEVYGSSAESRTRFPRVFNAIASKLNKYISRHQSITAAQSISDAEFIIFFNLLEYRRPLGTPYPYGDMFVILNDHSNGHQPRIIWKTRKSPLWAEDAIEEFLRDLKFTRGEG